MFKKIAILVYCLVFQSFQINAQINNSKEKFISLMLVFGQLNLLKLILKRFNIDNEELKKFEDLYFN